MPLKLLNEKLPVQWRQKGRSPQSDFERENWLEEVLNNLVKEVYNDNEERALAVSMLLKYTPRDKLKIITIDYDVIQKLAYRLWIYIEGEFDEYFDIQQKGEISFVIRELQRRIGTITRFDELTIRFFDSKE